MTVWKLTRRTRLRVVGLHIGRVFRQHDSKARLQMRVDVAVEEPRSRVVRLTTANMSAPPPNDDTRPHEALTLKRIVTLSPGVPVLTTSRQIGFS